MCASWGPLPDIPSPAGVHLCVSLVLPGRLESAILTPQRDPGGKGPSSALGPPSPVDHVRSLSSRLRNGVKYCKVLQLPEVSGAASRPLCPVLVQDGGPAPSGPCFSGWETPGRFGKWTGSWFSMRLDPQLLHLSARLGGPGGRCGGRPFRGSGVCMRPEDAGGCWTAHLGSPSC